MASNGARRMQKLEAVIEELERRLELRHDCYVLHFDANGAADVARFERQYGITPERVKPPAALVERLHYGEGIGLLFDRHRWLEKELAESKAAMLKLRGSDLGVRLAQFSEGVSPDLQSFGVAGGNNMTTEQSKPPPRA